MYKQDSDINKKTDLEEAAKLWSFLIWNIKIKFNNSEVILTVKIRVALVFCTIFLTKAKAIKKYVHNEEASTKMRDDCTYKSNSSYCTRVNILLYVLYLYTIIKTERHVLMPSVIVWFSVLYLDVLFSVLCPSQIIPQGMFENLLDRISLFLSGW